MSKVYALGMCVVLAIIGCGEQNRSSAGTTTSNQVTQAPKKSKPSAVLEVGTPTSPTVQRLIRSSLRPDAQKNHFKDLPHYTLDLELDFDLFTYTGQQTLTFTNREKVPLKVLYFFLYPNTKALTGDGGQNLTVSNVKVNGQKVTLSGADGALLKVALNTDLNPMERITVDMSFRGLLYRQKPNASDLKKLAVEQLIQLFTGHSDHAGGYGVFSYGEGIASMALWHPIMAAHDENGWDVDPGSDIGDRSYFDVSNFSVNVTVPKDVRVATTGVELMDMARKGTRHFVAGAVREFALQMSTQYDMLSTRVNDVKVNSWFLKSSPDTGASVLKQAADALRVFERDFGAYPYRELDVAQSPLVGGAGGVEFPGLVTIAHMFYGHHLSQFGLKTKQGVAGNRMLDDTREFVVAHEVAHQWWNAVVGSDSKRHPFVDEALANHSAIHYFAEIHGEDAAQRQRELQMKLPWHMSRMMGGRDRPVDLPTSAYENMVEYAAVVYAKGGLFFDAVRKDIGSDRFLAVIKQYYVDYAFKVASPEDLRKRLVAASSRPKQTQALIKRWLHEAYGDRDIGPIQFNVLLEQFFGSGVLSALDPRLQKVLQHRGFDEFMKLMKGLLGSDGQLRPDVDYTALFELINQVAGPQGNDVQRVIGAAGRILLKGNSVRPTDLIREVGGVIAGDDQNARKLVNAVGTIFEVLEAIDQEGQQEGRQ